MGTKMVSLRLDEGLLEWATGYAETRGVSRSELLVQGLLSYKEDCESGVPEFREMAGRQAYAQAKADTEQGVGVCPDRPPGLGHVWAGSDPKKGGGPRNPCRFCGTPGRGLRDETGKVVEDGYFERATADRTALFSRLRMPASAHGVKPKEGKR